MCCENACQCELNDFKHVHGETRWSGFFSSAWNLKWMTVTYSIGAFFSRAITFMYPCSVLASSFFAIISLGAVPLTQVGYDCHHGFRDGRHGKLGPGKTTRLLRMLEYRI